jgi:hypothetical protein
MIVVVVPALAIAMLACRYRVFRSLAAYHRSKTTRYISLTNRGCIYTAYSGKRMTGAEVKASPWHKRVSEIYERAAVWPWRPVEPFSRESE